MSFKRTIIASVIMILTAACVTYIGHGEDIHPNKPLSSFPTRIGQWAGTQDKFDSRIYQVLGVDDSFLGNYRHPKESDVQLYIGFYQSQREGDLIHSPKNCMPGAGWNIIKTSIETLDAAAENEKKISVIKLVLQNGIQKQIVLYWFQSRGRIISSEYMQKIFLVIDSIFRHRTDGSFVRLITPVLNDDEDKAVNTLKDFAVQLMPILNEYIPS